MKNTDRRNVAGMGHQQRDRWSDSDEPISQRISEHCHSVQRSEFRDNLLSFLEQHICPHLDLRLF